MLAGAVTVGLWVTRDARARGSSMPRHWGLAAVATPVGLPYYLYLRARSSRLEPRDSPRTQTDLALRAIAAAVVTAMLVATLLAPPDPMTQAIYLVATAVPLAAIALVATFWDGLGRPQSR